MVVLFWVLILVVFPKAKINLSAYNENYLDREQTTAIRGIFAVLILFSHLRSYIDLSTTRCDILFDSIMTSLGQLIVVMFLFYSGYGIFCSYVKKSNYTKGFPKNRIVKTLLHYDLAVFLFLILDFALGIKYESIDYVFCWIGWRTIGHSKWFVFDILALYIVTWIAFMLIDIVKLKNREKWLIGMTFTGAVLLIAFLYVAKMDDGSFWYDTIMVYPVGMLFANYKNRIDQFLKTRKLFAWGGIIAGLIAMYAIFARVSLSFVYNICACCFALIIVLLTMKIRVVNPMLLKLGQISFSIYIIQRWPMILMSYFGLNQHRYVFAIASIICAIGLAYIFDKMLETIDRIAFTKSVKE